MLITPERFDDSMAMHSAPIARRDVEHRPNHSGWLAAMLDEVDYGMLLVARDGTVLHANQVAVQALEEGVILSTLFRDGRAVLRDQGGLLKAIESAALRGLRKLLVLGGESSRRSVVAVVPLGRLPIADDAGAVLVVLGKRCVCDPLTVQCYALAHGLTGAETRVLARLCEGVRPPAIAERQGVALTTVRTQINAIRAKTHTASIAALIHSVTTLPPLMATTGRPAMNAQFGSSFGSSLGSSLGWSTGR